MFSPLCPKMLDSDCSQLRHADDIDNLDTAWLMTERKKLQHILETANAALKIS